MGQKLSILAQTTPYIDISSYIDLFDDIQFVKNLNNNSKFISTNQCMTLDEDMLITKVFIKPNFIMNEINTNQDEYQIKQDNKIDINVSLIMHNVNDEIAKLKDIPNTIPYSYVLDTVNAVYLFRPYVYESLKERMLESSQYEFETTRITILFKMFQMLKILDDVHDKGMMHGNINMNNFFVDSLDIVKLADFSMNLKPFYLREDMPNEIDFYFGKNNHNVVKPNNFQKTNDSKIEIKKQKYKNQGFYLSPERLNTQKRNYKVDKITEEIKKSDVFSLGCVFYEMLITLSHQNNSRNMSLFNIQDVFKFKNGDYSDYEKNLNLLKEIFTNDKSLEVQLIRDCTILDVEKRLSIKDILKKYKANGLFPDLFYSSMHKDICIKLNDIELLDFKFPDFGNSIKNTVLNMGFELEIFSNNQAQENQVYETNELTTVVNEYDIFESDVYKYLQYSELLKKYDESLLKQNLAISYIHILGKLLSTALNNINDIILCINNITLLSQYCDDSLKLDICIPYLFDYFNNCSSKQCKTHLFNKLLLVLSKVDDKNDSNIAANLHDTINYYIFPTLKKNMKSYDNETMKIVLKCIPRLLELTSNTKYLKKALISIISYVLTDQTVSNITLRIELLKQLPKFLNVLGDQVVSDLVLVHAITYLNENSTNLKIELIKCLCKIGEYLGVISFKEIIYPLLLQNLYLYKDDECIMLVVLQNLKNIIVKSIGYDQQNLKRNVFSKKDVLTPTGNNFDYSNKLLDKYDILELIEQHLVNFLLLPFKSCKLEVISILKHVLLNNIELSELYCLYYPLIKPYYHMNMDINQTLLDNSCRGSITSDQYDCLLLWNMKIDNSFFWKEKKRNSDANEFEYMNYFDNSDFNESLSMEDKLYFNNLKKYYYLKTEHLWKLAKLRSYIKKVSSVLTTGFKTKFYNKMERSKTSKDQDLNLIKLQYDKNIVVLKNISINTLDYQISFDNMDLANRKKTSTGFSSRRNSNKLIPQKLLNDALQNINNESSSAIESVDSLESNDIGVVLVECPKSEYTIKKSIPNEEMKDKNLLDYVESISVVPELKHLEELGIEEEEKVEILISDENNYKTALSNYTKINYDYDKKIKIVESNDKFVIIVNEEMMIANKNKLEIEICDLIKFDNSNILDKSKFIKTFDLGCLVNEDERVAVVSLKFWLNNIFVVSLSNGQNIILKLHYTTKLCISVLKTFRISKPEFLIKFKFADNMIYGLSNYSNFYKYEYVNNEITKIYEYRSKVMEEIYNNLENVEENVDYEVCKDFTIHKNFMFIITTMNNLYTINMDFKVVTDVYNLYEKSSLNKKQSNSLIKPFDSVNAYENGKLILTGGYSLSLLMIFDIKDFFEDTKNNFVRSKEVILKNTVSYYNDDLYDKFILKKVLSDKEYLSMKNVIGEEDANVIDYKWIDDKNLMFKDTESNDIILINLENGNNEVVFDNNNNHEKYKKYNMNSQLRLYYRNVDNTKNKINIAHFRYVKVDEDSSILLLLDTDSNMFIYNIYKT